MTVINMAEATGPYTPPAPPINPLQADVDRLQMRVDNLQRETMAWHRVWDALGEYLNEMAERHNLCSVYDSAVADWNSDHPEHQLPPRTVSLETEIRVHVHGTFRAGTDHPHIRAVVEQALCDLVGELDSEFDADSYVDVR